MAAKDNFVDDTMYFLEQQFVKVYSNNQITSNVEKMFGMKYTSSIPKGLTLDWTYGGTAQTTRVKSVTQERNSKEVYVVFTSNTLSKRWTAPNTFLPPPGAYSQQACGGSGNLTFICDIYRPGLIPECTPNGAELTTLTGNDLFYRYRVTPEGKLIKPRPIFVSEHVINPGHTGGSITTLADGKILYSTRDMTVYVLNFRLPCLICQLH